MAFKIEFMMTTNNGQFVESKGLFGVYDGGFVVSIGD